MSGEKLAREEPIHADLAVIAEDSFCTDVDTVLAATPDPHKELIDRILKKSKQSEYYQPPAEEDYYVPPGRQPYDREELNPSEDNIELGPPTLQNNKIIRQTFAIEEFMKKLREQISFNDCNSKIGPQHTIKPAIKNAFFVKEQRMADPDFIEPDDDQVKDKEAASLLVEYLKSYKENPSFIENRHTSKQAAADVGI